MQIRTEDGTLILRDQPGLEWIAGMLFATVGALFVLLPFVSATPVGPLYGALALCMGSVAVGAGIYIFANAPRSIVTVAPRRREIELRRISLFKRERETVPFRTVATVALEETTDGDGDPCWRPTLRLVDGRDLPLSRLYRHNKDDLDALCARLREAVA
ncbi:MAG: hypothetical protein JNL66_03300 [Alphaproteobacteria bacterium]|nr:hypothetical protein [Alphaproteobacteria bacterium]